jgi:hypothetical protein
MKTLQFIVSDSGVFLHEKIAYNYSVNGTGDPQISREYNLMINLGPSGNPAVVEITPAAKFEQLRESILANQALSEKLQAYMDFNSVTGLTPATFPAFAALTLLADEDLNMQEIMDALSTKIVSLGFGDWWECTSGCFSDGYADLGTGGGGFTGDLIDAFSPRFGKLFFAKTIFEACGIGCGIG